MKKINHIIFSIILAVTLSYSQGGFKRKFKLPNALNNTTKAVFETTANNYIVGGIVVDTLNGFTTNRLTRITKNGTVLD